MFTELIKHIIRLNRTPGAFQSMSIFRIGKNKRRTVKCFLQLARDQSRDALMNPRHIQDDNLIIPDFLFFHTIFGRNHANILSHPVRCRPHTAVGHLLPQFVELRHILCQAFRPRRIIGQQQLNALFRTFQSSGRVQTRTNPEAQMMHLDWLSIKT